MAWRDLVSRIQGYTIKNTIQVNIVGKDTGLGIRGYRSHFDIVDIPVVDVKGICTICAETDLKGLGSDTCYVNGLSSPWNRSANIVIMFKQYPWACAT